MKKIIYLLGIIFLFVVSGCKEPILGEWPAFQWHIGSVTNPAYSEIKIDKNGNVKIFLPTKTEKIVLVVSNYTPWSMILIEGNGKYEKEKEIIRDWGTVKLEQNTLTIDIIDLPSECTEKPIKLQLSEGDAFSTVEIYKRDA